MSKRPDIVFILTDQHARKIAGCYGDTIAETPNIDRIAARGVTFDRAYCPSPICTPSRMAMLSGRWPHEQQCWTLEDQLASDIPTYAHALGAGGYRTILCGRMHSVGPDQLHGFTERYVGESGPNWLGVKRQDLGVLAGAQGPSAAKPGEEHLASVSIRLSGSGQSGYEVNDDATTEAACRRLAELGRARSDGDATPFAMVVGFSLPHCPFVARRHDYARFAGRVGPARLGRSADEHPWITAWRRHGRTEAADPADVLRARTAYYGLVAAIDAKIGRILDALEAAGFGDDTLVVYSSDHGEQLGERDLWWKNTFYEESAGVPLVLSWPGHVRAGARSGHIVNLIDIGATMIAAAGAAPLPRARGRSLLGIAADEQAPWTEETFSEYVTDLSSVWTGPEATQQRMIRTDRWKLVYIHGYRPQLFDLANDPHESRDLGADPAHAEVSDRLVARVLAGWDPEAIRREVAVRCDEKAVFRAWGQATQPPSLYHQVITPQDSWLDDRR